MRRSRGAENDSPVFSPRVAHAFDGALADGGSRLRRNDSKAPDPMRAGGFRGRRARLEAISRDTPSSVWRMAELPREIATAAERPAQGRARDHGVLAVKT